MAYTKIHPIKSTVYKAINYICNSSKTQGKMLISSFCTSPETAKYDFQFALSKTNSANPNKAFHLIQSFSPGETTFDEAHIIGCELADQLLEGKYSYVIATHIDKGHCHNHIIFCAADNVEHKKYHDCKKSYYNIRKISDRICEKHSLSVILDTKHKEKNYAEWSADKNGNSIRTQLKKDIDDAIMQATSYEQFILIMRNKNYEIKGDTLGSGSMKCIYFKPEGYDHFFRTREKTLGAEYTKERIIERIECNQKKLLTANTLSNIRKPKPIVKDYSTKKIVSTDSEKFKNSPGLQHWADLQNLKIAASSYSYSQSLSELETRHKSNRIKEQSFRSELSALREQLKNLGEIIKYAEQYKDNEPYNYRYHKSKNPEIYYRTHESNLILYCGAKNVLERNGFNPKAMNISEIRNQYDELLEQKNHLSEQLRIAEKQTLDLHKKINNIMQYLGENEMESVKKEQKENQQSL